MESTDLGYDEKESLYEDLEKLKKKVDEKVEEVLNEVLPEAFAIVKDTARRFKENEFVEVTANDFDKDLAAKKDFVTIQGGKAVYKNRWVAGGNEIVWDMVHYDVQLIGGVVLHQGKISEMATGEGKTLVATLPVFLNALSGMGVHVVTVNDYLARRDSEWRARIRISRPFSRLHGQAQPTRGPQECLLADITFGTNNEFGFDYLRKYVHRSCRPGTA